MTIRDEIQIRVNSALETLGYQPQMRSNLTQITTDSIIKALLANLPPPVDIASKYEVTPNTGIYITLAEEKSERHNGEQLKFLASFSGDEGWNAYYDRLTKELTNDYLPSSVIAGKVGAEGEINAKEQPNPRD